MDPKIWFRGFQTFSPPHQNEILEASALLPVQRTTSARIPELPQALADCNFFLGSAAVGVSPLECASLVMEAWGTRVAVSWVQALAARLVPSLVSSLLVPGLVPGLVSSVIATLAPLRHASNLGGPFNLCSLLSAVSLGPPEGATTHDHVKRRVYSLKLFSRH